MKKTLVLLALLLLALSLGSAQAEIRLPANLTVISDQAFEGNAAFRGVIDVPGGVHAVGNYAFRDTCIFGLNLSSAVSSIGEGILEGANATYLTVGSASPSLAEGAFNGVHVIVGKPGGTVESLARRRGVPFYSANSLCYHDGFAYAPAEGGSVTLAFPTQPRGGSVVIPKSVGGMTVRGVSPTAFTNLTSVTEISLPDTVSSLPDDRISWPDATISFYPVIPDGTVYPPEVEQDPERAHQMSMLPAYAALVPGESVTPRMQDVPVGNWRRLCTWVSSDESVATVDENGMITAVGPGSAGITATVRIVSLNETSLPGEPLPEQVYYGVTVVDVTPGSLGVDIGDDTLRLTAGQTHYSTFLVSNNGFMFDPTVTLEYTDSLGRTQDSAEPPVVSCEVLKGDQILLQANTPGTATLTLNVEYMGKTASDVLEVTVSEPEIELNFTSLMTYPGYAYNLRVTSELPEGAAVTWTSHDPAVATVDENGHAVIGNSAGSTVIDCTVAYPDGAVAGAKLPVMIRGGIRWADAPDRTLYAGWEYHREFENLQPDLSCDLWPHDRTALTVTAESSDEHVLRFGCEGDMRVAYARYPGKADVTYTASMNRPANEDEIAPYTSLSRTFTATVVMPEMQVFLGEQQIDMLVGESRYVSCWTDVQSDIQREWFYSTDESVFTVTDFGQLTARGAGEAEFVYAIESYGNVYEARASVTVTGWEIELDPGEVTLGVGESLALLPRMVLPEGETGEAYNPGANYSSSNDAIVRVDGKGLITGMAPGTAVITYRVPVREPVEDGMLYKPVIAYCTVQVVDPDAAITFDKPGEQALQNGVLALYPYVETQLHAYDANGSELQNVTWSLEEDSGVSCELTSDGLMTFYGELGGRSDRIYVRASAQIDGSEVSSLLAITSLRAPLCISDCYVDHMLEVGETSSWMLILCFEDQQGMTSEEAWANGLIDIVSMNEDIVRVTEDGNLYAVAPGFTTMKVTLKTAEGVACDAGYFIVLVDTEPPVPNAETTIAFEREHYFLLADDPDYAEHAYVILNQSELFDFHGLTYSSSNPDIVEIDGDGNIRCTGQPGTATIYARIGDYIGKDDPVATATVTVVQPEITATVTHADGGTQTLTNGGEASLTLGETVTLEIRGLPIGGGEDQIPPEALEIGYNDYAMRRTEQSDLGDRQVFTGVHLDQSDLNVDIRLSPWQNAFYSFSFDVSRPSVDYRLGGDAFFPAAVGERVTLWPDFDCHEVQSVASSDERVLRIVQDKNAPVAFEVVGEGRATVTARCLLGDGATWVTAGCEVLAVPDVWTLNGIGNIPDILSVGETYYADDDISNPGTVWPDVTLTSSDPSILEVRPDDNDWKVIPLKAGRATLTLTASKEGGEPQSVSTEFLVTAPDVLLVPSDTSLRPGASELLELVVNASSPVARVEWSVDGAGIVTLHTDGGADTSAVITANADAGADNRSLVTAKVFFENGSYGYASCWAEIFPDENVWINVWLDQTEIDMNVGENRHIGGYHYDANAESSRESFASSDESVVAVNANGELMAKGPGEATVTYTAESYGVTASAEATVRVHAPQVSLNKSSIALSVGESEYLTAVGEQAPEHSNSLNFYSRNESVASVDSLGLVTGLSAGQTTIVCSANILGQSVELSCDVTVTDPAQKLYITSEGSPVTRMTVQPYQEIQLGVQASGTLTGDVQWRVSDEDSLLVENNGLLKVRQTDGMSHTCHVSATATVDGREQTAYCEIQIQALQFAIDIFPDAYQVAVGQSTRIWYAIIANDPSVEVYPEFISSDESVATVLSASGQAGKVCVAIKGVSEGNCSVRLALRDAQGKLLASREILVQVGGEVLTPMSEGVEIAFDRETYFLYDSEGEYDVYMRTCLEGADALLAYGYELVYESSDESVFEIYSDGNMRAVSAGEADVTAWFRGYEDGPRATAHVTVRKPEIRVTVTDRDGTTRVCAPGEDGAYEMEAGSYVKLELVNPPETTPLEQMDWGFDGNALTTISRDSRSITLCPRFECTTDIFAHIGIPTSVWFTHNVALRVLNAPVFFQPYLRANPGETVDLWPAFEWNAIQDVVSSDANVVQITGDGDCPVRFTAVAPGKATVSARVQKRDGAWVDLSGTVEVAEKRLEILNLDPIPSAMVVDDRFDQQPNIDYNGFCWPEFDWEVSDETVIEVVRRENQSPQLHTLRPGTVTLTAVVTSGDITRRMSKTVVVTQQPVSFATLYVSVRPGSQFTLPLHVNLEHANVSEIRVSTLDETVAAAELITLDNGDPAALVTGVGAGNDTRVFADVVMTDGSVYSAAAGVHLIPNWEIWADAFAHDIQLSTETWGSAPTHGTARLGWNTNALLADDPNQPGPDTAQIEWSIDDENVARIDGFSTDENGNPAAWNNGPVIAAVGEGSTQLRAVLTLCDKDGAFLTQCEASFPINVSRPDVQLYPGQETYEMNAGEMRHIEWGESVTNAGPVDRDFQYSDDDSIASFNINGHLQAMKPGETDIHYQIVFKDGTTFTASAHVVVTGMEMAFVEDSVTIAVGETIKPTLVLNENGVTNYNRYFETSDPSIATVLSDGTVYGVAPGTTVLHAWADAPGMHLKTYCTVNVTGEAPVFTLDAASLSLFPEQTAQLTPVYTGEGALENVIWSSDAPHAVQVDGDGRITTSRVSDIADPSYVTVTCEATANGQTLRATCLVTMKKPGLLIREHQFGEGRWVGMGVGDWHGIYERYLVADPSLTVERSVTVDDPNVAQYDAAQDAILAVGPGHTFAHYTVTADNGESHTRDLYIRVDEDCMSESITPVYGVFVVPFQWNQHYLPLNWEPMYTGCYTECTSSDPSILSFDDGPGSSEMYFHGVEGLVTVDITCPENPALNTQAQVLVIDEQNRRFTLEPEDGSTVLSPGQTVQLVFKNGYGLDLSGEVHAIHYPSHFSPDTFRLTQDGRLTVLTTKSMSNCQIWADVALNNGYNVPVTYSFSVDAENNPYFFLKQESGAERFILAPRSGIYLQLVTNQTFDNSALQLSSSNPEIATVQQDENGLLVIGESAGEATISVSLPEAGLIASYPITVIEPTELNLGMSTSAGNVVRVGDEFEAYTWHEDPLLENSSNLDRRHTYVSSDPSVLDTLEHLDGEGSSWMTFRALKPGTVTITSNAWLENYPEITDVDTMTITVIP